MVISNSSGLQDRHCVLRRLHFFVPVRLQPIESSCFGLLVTYKSLTMSLSKITSPSVFPDAKNLTLNSSHASVVILSPTPPHTALGLHTRVGFWQPRMLWFEWNDRTRTMSPVCTVPLPAILSIINIEEVHAVSGELFLPRHLFRLHLSAQAIQHGSVERSDLSVILCAEYREYHHLIAVCKSSLQGC